MCKVCKVMVNLEQVESPCFDAFVHCVQGVQCFLCCCKYEVMIAQNRKIMGAYSA